MKMKNVLMVSAGVGIGIVGANILTHGLVFEAIVELKDKAFPIASNKAKEVVDEAADVIRDIL